MTKKEMIADVIEGFKKFHNSTEMDVEYEFHFLKYLKGEQLRKILFVLNELSPHLTINQAHDHVSREGLFKVEPRVVDTEEGIPHFMFRKDKYLSWFRGYRFQVSGDTNAGGCYGDSDGTLVNDLELARVLPPSLQPTMAFSHVCQATAGYQDFWEFVNENPKVMDKFMQETHDVERIYCKDFSLKAMWSLIQQTDTIPISADAKYSVLSETGRKGKDENAFATMIYDRTFIAIRLYNEKHWNVIYFPKYTDTSKYLREYFNIPGYYDTLYRRLTWILLIRSSVVMNFMYTYPVKKFEGVPTDVIPNEAPYVIRSARDLDDMVRNIDFKPDDKDRCAQMDLF